MIRNLLDAALLPVIEAVLGAGFGVAELPFWLVVRGGVLRVLRLAWPVAETFVVSAMRPSISCSYEETYVLVCSTISVRASKMILTISKKLFRKCSKTCLAEC